MDATPVAPLAIRLFFGLGMLVLGVVIEISSRPAIPISYRPHLLFLAVGLGIAYAYAISRLPQKLAHLHRPLHYGVLLLALFLGVAMNVPTIAVLWFYGTTHLTEAALDVFGQSK